MNKKIIRLFSRGLLFFVTCATFLVSAPAGAVVTRHGAYSTFGTPENTRYLNLANQSRFDTVGNISLHTPVAALGTQFSFTNSCTGTLISSNIVLTAAHCFSDGGGNITSFQQTTASRSALGLMTGQQVFFAGGSNLATNANYSTTNIDYAVQFDRLSIHPSFDLNNGRSIGFGADLALLRVFGTPWIGSLPTNYIPLNSSNEEDPPALEPNFGITIGYGRHGDGFNGATVANSAVEKRAGLTEVDYSLLFNETLTSDFASPATYNSLSYPANFLQAFPGPGDSGGPLIMNLGSGDSIVGVVQGGGSTYGDDEWWTRISSYISWISSEAAVLGSAPITAVSGSSFSAPLLPNATNVLNPLTTLKQFSFFGSLVRFVYADPESSEITELSVESGPLIQSLLLPEDFGSDLDVWMFNEGSGIFEDSGFNLEPGVQFDFSQAVDKIQLIAATGSDQPLTLGFLFDGDGFVELDWLSTTSVPIPPAVWLFGSALGLLGWMRRKVA